MPMLVAGSTQFVEERSISGLEMPTHRSVWVDQAKVIPEEGVSRCGSQGQEC